jgi:putative sugar O-methyltransferase
MSAVFFGASRPSLYRRTQLLIDHVYRYRLLKKLMPDLSPEKLHVEDFGNPYGMYVDGKFVRTGTDYQYYYANQVKQLLCKEPDHAVVAELGGGIGGFAHFLMKARGSRLTYINLDLPEILCISTYQLLNLFPEKKSVLYGEIENINTESLSCYDIALMPCFVIEALAPDSVDVVFNSYSLAEMDAPTIENYAKQFSRICKKNILHINHVTNSLVSANDFPFDEKKFSLVSRRRAEWNIGRDLNCDEYEFIYERINVSPTKLAAKNLTAIQ